jgi:hypothetical protein
LEHAPRNLQKRGKSKYYGGYKSTFENVLGDKADATAIQLNKLGSILERSRISNPNLYSNITDVLKHSLTSGPGAIAEGAGALAAGHPLGAVVAGEACWMSARPER